MNGDDKAKTHNAPKVEISVRIESSRATGVLTLVAMDQILFQDAEQLFRQYDTASLSFTDCTSFVVCQQRNISEAFAFDQHFPMMGITLRG